MLHLISKLKGTHPKQVMDPQLSKILLDEGPARTDDKFDGWYHFIDEAVPSYKRQKDAYEWVKGSGACKYEHALWKAIASHMYFRTKRHPDIEVIKDLDRGSVNNCDYIKQLAYNCMMYEAQLLAAPDKTTLETLREMTASIS